MNDQPGTAPQPAAPPVRREDFSFAKNAMGNELKLHIDVDTEEEIDLHTVTWRDLCGYFSVSFHCKTEHEARQLFKALQAVNDYDAS